MNNRYGLDVQYFTRWMERILIGGLDNYLPHELARELARMSRAADDKVLLEPEFQPVQSNTDKPEVHAYNLVKFSEMVGIGDKL